MKRQCIYTSDIEAITGKSKKTAQKIMRTIKDVYQKKKHQVVTIREFCNYTGFEYEDVFNEINKKHTA